MIQKHEEGYVECQETFTTKQVEFMNINMCKIASEQTMSQFNRTEDSSDKKHSYAIRHVPISMKRCKETMAQKNKYQ